MTYNKIVISSGHGLHVRGASGILDEVDEARRVVDRLAKELANRGVSVTTFHDDTSTSQNQNLNTIVNFHNSETRDLDISVHFNAYEQVSKPMGTEVLYVTQQSLAAQVSSAIASVGFINRGAKKRTDLAFLNGTEMPAIFLEICFVDSEADAEIYDLEFDHICDAIADVLGGDEDGDVDVIVPPGEPSFHAVGKVSHFGGPEDMGVSSSEGLAFIYSLNEDNQHLFLPMQPWETTGLARRLNPHIHYLACRWDYDVTSKEMLAGPDVALVRNPATGFELTAFPADWGPHSDTDRVADISPGLMTDLALTTDDEVEVIYPWKG